MIAAGRAFAAATADETDTAEDYCPMGFLAADDNRACYYMDSATSQWLYDHDYLTDTGKDIIFLSTDFRAELVSTQCTDGDMYVELVSRHTNAQYAVSASSMIIFSHENRIQKDLDGVKGTMEKAAQFAKDFGIEFAFPQERTFDATEKDFATSPAPDYAPEPEPLPKPEPGSGSNEDVGEELPEIDL